MPRPEGPSLLDEVAAAFARACRTVEVDYVFVGGFAVIAWGQPRTTSDIGALVGYREPSVPPLAEALEAEGLETSVYDLRAPLKDGSHVTVFTADPVLTVDVKPALERRETDQIEASVEIGLGGDPVRVASAADTVAFKVLFGSEQDLQDARSIVARQGQRLDRERLWRTAREQGVLAETQDLVRSVDEVTDTDQAGP